MHRNMHIYTDEACWWKFFIQFIIHRIKHFVHLSTQDIKIFLTPIRYFIFRSNKLIMILINIFSHQLLIRTDIILEHFPVVVEHLICHRSKQSIITCIRIDYVVLECEFDFRSRVIFYLGVVSFRIRGRIWFNVFIWVF